MEKWEEKLLERVHEIIAHGWGELNVNVVKIKQKTQITIKAGEVWQFSVDKKFDKSKIDVIKL